MSLRMRSVWQRAVAGCLATCMFGSLSAATASASAVTVPKKPGEYKLAESSLLQGRIEDAVMRLHALIAANPKDAPSRLLLCRAYYAEDLIDEAVAACGEALEQAPDNSQIEDWLGRAYGQKADRSGPIAGYQLARKVKAAFESAVLHDPHNNDAISDLTDYYVDAPALVGGGMDKAYLLADRVAAQCPQQAHRTRALAAEKRHEFDTAEREFRDAVNVALRPDAWVDLAAFYKRRHQEDKAMDALRHCLSADPAHDAAIVDAATILHEMHRDPQLAEQTLRLYLDSNAKTDDAPAIKVHVLLSKMRAEAGDKAGAKIEVEAALTLAPHYAPARQALRQL
jgi:tetratricopeptide (TPR) repeat protein